MATNLEQQLINLELGFTLHDLTTATDISANVGRMIYTRDDDKISIEIFFELYQACTEAAIRASQPLNVYCMWMPKYGYDRAFPWFDQDLEIALKSADFKTFLMIFYGWYFMYEERDDNIKYAEAKTFLAQNEQHGAQILTFIEQHMAKYGALYIHDAELPEFNEENDPDYEQRDQILSERKDQLKAELGPLLLEHGIDLKEFQRIYKAAEARMDKKLIWTSPFQVAIVPNQEVTV